MPRTATSKARTTRARKQNPTPALDAHGDVVQDAIDRMAEAGDAVPSGNQIDSTNLNNDLNASAPPDPLESKYNLARARGSGYLARVRSQIGRSALVPPTAEVHPRLGRWAVNWGGKWLILRWIGIRGFQRQRRREQGYQYFEGSEEIRRLGLDPECVINERGRVQSGDAELAWCPEEFVFEHEKEAQERKESMVATARDNVYRHISEAIPEIHQFEGSNEEVEDSLDRLRKGGRVHS